jgi:hypothetical protein
MEKKLKIVVVSSAFYPENSPRSFRTTELVKGLCRRGHDVTLYTIRDERHHAPIEKEFGVRIVDLGRRRFGRINLQKGSGPVLLFKRLLNRALLQFFEYPDIELMFKIRKKLRQDSGYDLMVSIAVPHPVHWGVAWARTRKNPIAKTWVADCGDPYMGAIGDSMKKLFYFKYLEKWFCRKSEYIAIPLLSMKENFYPEFSEKFVEIPQGFNLGDIVTDPYVPNRVPTFAFAGTFMRNIRNPGPMLKFLSEWKEDFRFIAYTQADDLLAPFKEALGNKLEVRPYIPRLQLIREMSRMDFLVNIGYDPVHQVPSKLIDYHLSGRPILSFPTSTIDEQQLAAFLRADYRSAFIIPDVNKYNIDNVCARFTELA